MRWVLVVMLGCARAPAPAPVVDSDPRTPVPLLPMMAQHQKQSMRDHLLAVQEVVSAVAIHDFPAAEKAAKRLGSSPQMKMMCTHMGAGAPGFTERALAFHEEADAIAVAANKQDGPAVLGALGKRSRAARGVMRDTSRRWLMKGG